MSGLADVDTGRDSALGRLLAALPAETLPSLSTVDPGVVDDLLEMLHDVLGSWARGEGAPADDWSARILAAQIPAYAALGRLTRLHHETGERAGPNDHWLVLVRRAMQLLLEAADCMGQAARVHTAGHH